MMSEHKRKTSEGFVGEKFIDGPDGGIYWSRQYGEWLVAELEASRIREHLLADEVAALKARLSKMGGALAEYYRSESRATISVDSYRLAREATEALAGESR